MVEKQNRACQLATPAISISWLIRPLLIKIQVKVYLKTNVTGFEIFSQVLLIPDCPRFLGYLVSWDSEMFLQSNLSTQQQMKCIVAQLNLSSDVLERNPYMQEFPSLLKKENRFITLRRNKKRVEAAVWADFSTRARLPAQEEADVGISTLKNWTIRLKRLTKHAYLLNPNKLDFKDRTT